MTSCNMTSWNISVVGRAQVQKRRVTTVYTLTLTPTGTSLSENNIQGFTALFLGRGKAGFSHVRARCHFESTSWEKKIKKKAQFFRYKKNFEHPSFQNVLLKTLKGLSTLKWTCSGFKGLGLLILPLTLIFILVKPLKTAVIPGKNFLIQSANPISSSRQILVIRPANPLCSSRQIPVLHVTIPRL